MMDKIKDEREYQTFLIQKAQTRNIIACLPTGSGKTYIALQLIKYYLPETIKNKKKIVFLANTLPLVNQQAVYFCSELSNSFASDECRQAVVECFTSERNVDKWDEAKWNSIVANCHVMVMIPKVMQDALHYAYITWKDVIFMIFDECHHTDKNHNMNNVMKSYLEAKAQKLTVPRVLGLTATILNGKKAKTKVEKEVEAAEKRLDARALTYPEYEEVLKYSTSATLDFANYSSSCSKYLLSQSDNDDILSSLEQFKRVMEYTNEKLFERDYVSEINNPSLRYNKQVYNSKKTVVKKLESIIDDVVGVYKDLGPYCAKIAAVTKRAFIQLIPTAQFKNKYVKNLYYGLDTALVTFIAKLERLMCRLSKAHQLDIFISDKIQQVLDVMVKFSREETEELCGIVFVEKRITAQSLAFYLQDMSALPAFNFIKADFVIGSSQFQQDSQAMRVTTKRQADVIRKFHAKTINLIIATNVIEEGLNVPDCNLVLRFDEIQTYPSYVQSMGRARKKNSKFYCLVLDEKAEKLRATYKSFDECNSILASCLQKKALHPDKEDDNENSAADDIIPPFEPFGIGKTPKITAIESISVATRYCQTLACDRLVTLNPVSWWEEVNISGTGKSQFKAFIQFPANAVIREVEGDVHNTKVLAKRSAFLKACKLLYEHNALDNEHLLPYSRSQNLKNLKNKFMDSITIEQDTSGKKVGSNNRKQQNRRKLPNCLEMTRISPNSTCKVYQIVLQQVGEKNDEVSTALYRFSKRKFAYGFLTPLEFNWIPKFHLEVNSTVGFIAVTLQEIPLNDGSGAHYNYYPSSDDLGKLEGFERYIMGDLLKLKRDIMRNATSTPFLVVPLQKTMSSCFHEKFKIDWDLIKKVSQVNTTTTSSASFFEVSPEGNKQKKEFKFNPDDFEDAVVIPNYKGGDDKELYVVLSVCPDMTPLTPFTDSTNVTYMTYFMDKYPSTVGSITDQHQNLLKVKGIGENLNFFTRKRSNQKSKEERQEKKTNVSQLIPELCDIHSMPASLFIQTKFLPSICHRIIRFFCAKEIQEFVQEDAPWTASVVTSDDSEVTLAAKKMKKNHAFENGDWTTDTMNGYGSDVDVDVKSDGEVDTDEPMEMEGENSESNIVARVQEEDDLGGLEDVHPNELSRAQLEALRSNQRHEQDPFMDDDCLAFIHEKQTDIELVDIDSLKLQLKSFATCPLDEPSVEKIMEAITLENAQDCYSLERLETIGDSFLKYCVSRHLFCHFSSLDEGKMTHWRSTLVSNAHLYQMAKSTEIKLGEFLAGGYFFPMSAWLPLTFDIPARLAEAAARNDVNEDIYLDENVLKLESQTDDELDEFIMDKMPEMKMLMQPHVGYTHARIPDKCVADSVESLIGAYYISGGSVGALHFMKRLGLRGPTKEKDEEGVPFGSWEIPNPKIELRDPERHDWTEFVPRKAELESIICYEFKDPWILVEAFTHASYSSNTVTGSYERLEFLGDAVLDFLVTDHIYNNSKKNLTPGQLTDLRSALVNNVTFGSLAVRYGLEKYLLRALCSKILDDAISSFVRCQIGCGHQVKGHFTQLSESDCGSKTLLVKDIDVPKVLGDIFESLAGAVFLDCGMDLDTVWRVFYRLLKNEIDLFSEKVPKSPVRELHERFPGRNLFSTLSPQESKEEVDERGGNFTYVVLTVPIQSGDESDYKRIVGAGKNKQSAKLGAAKFALRLLNGST